MSVDQFAHRSTQATIRLTADGAPLAGREVTVAQRTHDFRFGCIGFDFVDPSARSGPLVEPWFDLFNTATLPFYWGQFEPARGEPRTARLRDAAQWLVDRGVEVKGHPLAWHTVTAPWLLDLSDQEILEAQLARIRRDVGEFAGLIDAWDVINEVVIMPIFDKYDNGITRARGRGPHRRARAAEPHAPGLLG